MPVYLFYLVLRDFIDFEYTGRKAHDDKSIRFFVLLDFRLKDVTSGNPFDRCRGKGVVKGALYDSVCRIEYAETFFAQSP